MNNKKNILSLFFVLFLYPFILQGKPFFVPLHVYRHYSKEWFNKYKIYPLYSSLVFITTLFEKYMEEKLYEYRTLKYPHLHEDEEHDTYLPPYQ